MTTGELNFNPAFFSALNALIRLHDFDAYYGPQAPIEPARVGMLVDPARSSGLAQLEPPA